MYNAGALLTDIFTMRRRTCFGTKCTGSSIPPMGLVLSSDEATIAFRHPCRLSTRCAFESNERWDGLFVPARGATYLGLCDGIVALQPDRGAGIAGVYRRVGAQPSAMPSTPAPLLLKLAYECNAEFG